MRNLAVTAAMLLAGLALVSARQNGMSSADRDLTRQMLRDIREDLGRNYYDKSYRNVSLDALFADARQRLDVARSANEAAEILSDTLVRFNDSHTRFFPPQRSTHVDYGWRMAMVGDAPLVVRVDPGSDAEAKGLRPGDRVLALNRFRPVRDNLWQIGHYYSVIRPQSQQRLVIQKPDGSQRVLVVNSRVERKGVQQLTDAIEDAVSEAAVEWQREGDRDRLVEPGVLVWRLTRFGDEDDIKRVIAKASDVNATALVVDLRDNGGGAVDALRALVGATFDREVTVVSMHTRKGVKHETARPARKRFSGRLIVLVDARSASASEIYARVVQLEGRGTVIGDRTAGMVMVSEFHPHTFGLGNVTAYATSITVADARMRDGASLEGVGVTPDVPMVPSPSDLAAGRDPVLARAIAEAGGTLSPEQAGSLYLQAK